MRVKRGEGGTESDYQFFFSKVHIHTHPEGREKYVLALHEYDSSTSLSMAFSAAPQPKCSLVSHKVAQQGEVLTLPGSYQEPGLAGARAFRTVFVSLLCNLLFSVSSLRAISQSSTSPSLSLHSHAAAQIIPGFSPGPYHDLSSAG